MLRSPPPKKLKTEETQFETVCRLAREQDIDGLNEIKERERFFIYLTQDGYSAPMLLALEGNEQAVMLLLHHFGASADDAVRGYAEAGLVDQVNELVIRRSSDEFVSSQAYMEYVSNRPFVFQGWQHAIEGYVRAGLDDWIDDILNAHPDMLDVAVKEYVSVENWDKAEQVMARGGKLNPDDLTEECLQEDGLAFRLMALVSNEETRRQILIKSNAWLGDDEFAFIQPLKNAGRLHRLMQEYHLSRLQALPLHALQENNHLQGVRTWLLQGLQIASTRSTNALSRHQEAVNVLPLLSKDLFLTITSLLLQLSMDDTRKVLVGVQSHLFASVAKENAVKFAHGLFSSTKYMVEQVKEVDTYESKVKRLKN